MTVSYDILATVCMICLVCQNVYMYDVRHDMQIPSTRYLAVNHLYFYLICVSKARQTSLSESPLQICIVKTARFFLDASV